MNNAFMQKINWDKMAGLVPAVVQDVNTRQVLMVGYVNRESLQRTFKTGKVTFFSRSKQCLWVKGESSGNYLNYVKLFVDCDGDALLIQAKPEGPTCHLGTKSCFGGGDTADLGFLIELEGIINERKNNPKSKSYTSKLFAEGIRRIAQKLGEEGVEVALAAVGEESDKLCAEAADLVYHLIVLLRARNLNLQEIVTELSDRSDHKK